MDMTAPDRATILPSSTDEYFADEAGLVAVYDFDYETIIDFEFKLQAIQFLHPAKLLFGTLFCIPCFLKQNVEWKARAKHVALTIDGIRFVTDKHKTCWGFSCTDRGKESKTVPYDKITDCDVQEPAGMACCCCIPNVLTKVHVDTASSNQLSHELVLKGLKNGTEFKAAVWAMKRGELPHGVHTSVRIPMQSPDGQATAHIPLQSPGGQAIAPRQNVMSGGLQDSNTAVLLEIRDELRQLNAHLREKQ